MLETSSDVQEAVGSMQTLVGRVHPTANKPLRIPAVRLDGTDKPTVWSEFGELASQTHAVNLGQGFPDWQPPEFVVEQAHEALRNGHNQYTRPAGHPALVEVLAERYSRHLQRDVCAMTEVAVTVGASQALYITLQALVNPGEEVLLLEPAFDLYYGQVKLAGASVVPVALQFEEREGEWRLDAAALEAAITSRTKLLILNSPHNPTGKVFTADEMAAIAEIVRRHPNLLVISDEVYKYIVHSGGEHAHFAALPGMFDRTVTLSSAGKTFSITGWQNGWCVGPQRLIKPIQLLLPFVQFCAATPMQQALSRILPIADKPYEGQPSYYAWLCQMYQQKRCLLADGLTAAGLRPLKGQGGFFLMADTSALEVRSESMALSTAAAPQMTRDWALCRQLATEAGVICIPASPFYSQPNKHLAANLARFAFCKGDDTLLEASARLAKIKPNR